MKNERILSYKMSQALTEDDLQSVSAAGWTTTVTGNGSYHPGSGWDGQVDVTFDPF